MNTAIMAPYKHGKQEPFSSYHFFIFGRKKWNDVGTMTNFNLYYIMCTLAIESQDGQCTVEGQLK